MDMFGFEADGTPKDAHAVIAEQVGLTRQDSKPIGHGWNYGLGAKAMIRDGMDPEKVYRFINGMETRFPRLIGWREEIRAQGKAGMILDNGFGRRMRCEPSRAYTVAPALMGQGGARDIMGECLLRLPEWTWPMLRAMVHDEIVMSVPAEAVQDVTRVVTEAMTWWWAPPGKPAQVPVLCDINGPGLAWGNVSEKCPACGHAHGPGFCGLHAELKGIAAK
jgi:DNA polymerase I